jgi:hypothetical protein
MEGCMVTFKSIGKFSFNAAIFILGIAISLALTFGFAIAISIGQNVFFGKGDYILMSAQDSGTRIMFIFEVFFIYMFFYLKYKNTLKSFSTDRKITFYTKHKSKTIILISMIIILLTYYIVTSVSVFYNNKLIYHSFFIPQGKQYSYSDIKEIDTGFYRSNIPLIKQKGDFYYNILLKDETKINVSNSGSVSTKNDKDVYLAIRELDQIFVKTDAKKIVDKEYFSIGIKNLDKLYVNRIRDILINVK